MLDATSCAAELSRGKKVGGLDPYSETALALTRLLEILEEAGYKIIELGLLPEEWEVVRSG